MPDRTLEDYQALWRDFERLDYMNDSTSAVVYEKPFGWDRYVKEVWDVANKRYDVFNAAIENQSFERCEAYGFLSIYYPSQAEDEKELEEHLNKQKGVFGIAVMNFLDSNDFKVFGDHPHSFMNYSLENMREYLQQLARGEEIPARHKISLDNFLDECAVAGGCIIRAMDQRPKPDNDSPFDISVSVYKKLHSIT